MCPGSGTFGRCPLRLVSCLCGTNAQTTEKDKLVFNLSVRVEVQTAGIHLATIVSESFNQA